MIRRKFFRRVVTVFLIVISLMAAAVVGAAVEIFDGRGECEMGEFAPIKTARERATQRAQLDAQKKAGVYLKKFSRSVNSELTDETISVVTNNIIEIVGEVKYENITQKITDQTTAVVVVATLKAKIDPEGIYDFIKRDEKEKATIIQQNDNLQDAIAKNDKEFEDLKEQYKRATTQTEKDRIRKQLNDADRDFLANEKLKEGERLVYNGDYESAISLFNEAMKLNPNYALSYDYRGTVYHFLGNYEQAIKDTDKAIELNPNEGNYYYNRATTCIFAKRYKQALDDFTRAIELHSDSLFAAYNNRGMLYHYMGDDNKSLADFNKAIQMQPYFGELYNSRGDVYRFLKKYDLALADFNKADKLGSDNPELYFNRCRVYSEVGKSQQASQDFKKALNLYPNLAENYIQYSTMCIELHNFSLAAMFITDVLQFYPNNASAYQIRGKCYQALGDEAKAQADFAKAKELGYKG